MINLIKRCLQEYCGKSVIPSTQHLLTTLFTLEEKFPPEVDAYVYSDYSIQKVSETDPIRSNSVCTKIVFCHHTGFYRASADVAEKSTDKIDSLF